MLPIADAARAAFPAVDLDEAQAADVRVGRALDLEPGRPHGGLRTRRGVPGALRAARRRGQGRRRLRAERRADRVLPVQIWRSLDEVPADLGPTAVVIGNFDGVHLGHRHVLARAREIADERSLPVVAVTFDPHPMAVLRPEHAPTTLTSLDVRAELLGRRRRRRRAGAALRPRRGELDAGGVRRAGAGRGPARRGRRGRRQLPLRPPGRRRRRDPARDWRAASASRPRGSRSTAARRCGRRPTSGSAWPPATSPAPPRRWAARTPCAGSSCGATSAAASSASRPPTCPPTR